MRILLTQKYTSIEQELESLNHEVRSFAAFPQARTFQSMLEEIAPFDPDLILTFYPELNSLPPDCYHLDKPMIPVVLDYHLNFQSLAIASAFFNAIVVNGKDVVPFLKDSGAKEVFWHPLVTVDFPPLHPLDNERPIDVVFVGQVDEISFQERARVIQELMTLLPQYNIKILSGIDYHEALDLYRKSKIVFNHAVRPDVLNQRSIDVLACGALLFVNQENHGTLDWLNVEKEAIAYQKSDLIRKLKHYLENPEERLAIASSGQRKLNRYRKTHEEQKKELDRFLTTHQIQSGSSQLSELDLFSSGLFLSPPPALEESELSNPILANNVGVAYWSCASFLPTDSPLRKKYSKLALAAVNQAVQMDQQFLPAHWNRARLLFWHQLPQESTKAFHDALKLLREGAPWPFLARPAPWYGILDDLTIRFSSAFMNEKLYRDDPSKQLNGLILSGIFSPLVQMAATNADLKEGMKLIETWESLSSEEDPVREWLHADILRKSNDPCSLSKVVDLLLRRPFSFPVSYLRQTAVRFWHAGMHDASISLTLHVLRRHLAASLTQGNNLEWNEVMTKLDSGNGLLEGLALLEEIPKLHDFAKAVS